MSSDLAAFGTGKSVSFACPDVLSEPEKLLASYFSSSTVGHCIVDAELRFLVVNDALAKINGVSVAEHLGKSVRDVLGEFADFIEPALKRVLLTGEPVLDFEVSTTLPNRTELGRWIANYFPIKDGTGQVQQIGALVVERTEAEAVEESSQELAKKPQPEKGRLDILREIDQALSCHKSPRRLFQIITACIGKVIPYDLAGTWLYEPENQVMRAAALDSRVGEAFQEGQATTLAECMLGQTMMKGTPAVINYDDLIKIDFPSAKKLVEHGIQSACCLPLITPKGPIGALGLGSRRDGAFLPEDVDLLNHVATSVALALENVLTHLALEQETERLQVLLDVSNALAQSKVDFKQAFSTISVILQEAVPHDAAFVTALNLAAGTTVLQALGSNPNVVAQRGVTLPLSETLSGQLLDEREARSLDRKELEKYSRSSQRLADFLEEGYQWVASVPLHTPRGKMGFLFLGRKDDKAFTAHDMDLLTRVASEMALAAEVSAMQEALLLEKSRLQALQEIDSLLLSSLEVQQFVPQVLARLRKTLAHDEMPMIFVHDENANDLGKYPDVAEPKQPDSAPLDLDNSLVGRAFRECKTIVMNHAELLKAPFTIAGKSLELGVRSACFVPMRTAQGAIGVLSLASHSDHAFGAEDIGFIEQATAALAHALGNARAHKALRLEEERLRVLLKTGASVASNLDVREVFPSISAHVRHVKQHEFASLMLRDDALGVLRRHAVDFPFAKKILPADFTVSLESPAGRALKLGRPLIFSKDDIAAFGTDLSNMILEEGLQSLCCVPLSTSKESLGTLNFGSTKANAFYPEDLELFSQIASQVAAALENERAYREIEALKNRLTAEKQYLEGEIRTNWNFEEIVGESSALKHVLDLATTVAASSASVLLLGETGTGKELVARAIHRMSKRKERNFIKVNCAAIPTGLLESELFGHERGAFTGAISQKIGRMELAHGGTLFLDEVGEIPLELQPKLLRVLQDQEFERLGSTKTIKVDVRLVTATNRDLPQRVADNEFRSDLFYRINVFPVRLPSLRERREDIPLLIRHFVRKFAERLDRQIETIPKEAMAALMEWKWSGNVRELENLMERSVILSDGPVLCVPLAELRRTGLDAPVEPDRTLDTTEREHILRVLRETGGILSGPNGAARRLGLKRTTLQSKMGRLHISRQEYFPQKRH